MTSIQLNRLKSLMYWVRYRHRCQEKYNVTDVITQQQFINEVDEYIQRHGTMMEAA